MPATVTVLEPCWDPHVLPHSRELNHKFHNHLHLELPLLLQQDVGVPEQALLHRENTGKLSSREGTKGNAQVRQVT